MQQFVVVIYQTDEAGEGRDPVTLDTEGKAAAVQPLVVEMGNLADPGFEGLQLVEHLQPVLGMHVEKIELRLAEFSPFLGDLARDLELADIVQQAGQASLLDLDMAHAELPCHQHGDEGHAQAVLQQDVRVLAADEVQTQRSLMVGEASGDDAHHLGGVGQPLVGLEIEGAEGVTKI